MVVWLSGIQQQAIAIVWSWFITLPVTQVGHLGSPFLYSGPMMRILSGVSHRSGFPSLTFSALVLQPSAVDPHRHHSPPHLCYSHYLHTLITQL
ncbi:hypothetical protein BDP27DRAFT_703207 [Rhodocollybia butyracea]|uniref:Uncharacterized protein n=1 Tax=Rhodocollybia butyracea TaxID=206335 RepID=A0A9P5UE42_9AGAR|nr:hypothetical protein BDP27DRAFT_703207 [Rhodocollybia butyracea]